MQVSKKKRESIVDIYLASHLNHIYLNDLSKKSGGSEYRWVILEPNRVNGNRVLVSLICVMYWLLTPLLFLYKGMLSVLKKSRYPFIDREYKKCFLQCLNNALPRIVQNANIDTSESVWIVLDESEQSHVSFYRYLSYIDVIRAYFISLVAYYKSVFKYGIEVSILACEAYDFILMYKACSCIPLSAELYFCNHMERNAVLIDHLPQKCKYLLQHGTLIIRKLKEGLSDSEMAYVESQNFWTYNLPYKYKSISKVYAFSEKEYDALCSSILNNRPLYDIVGYSIRTTPIVADRRSVLIVGYYSGYARLEEELIKGLQNHGIKIFLKNHPTQAAKLYNHMRYRYEFEFIDSPYFPAVDYVVSYDSTLALEYESMGSKVLYYDEYKISQIIEQILKEESR